MVLIGMWAYLTFGDIFTPRLRRVAETGLYLYTRGQSMYTPNKGSHCWYLLFTTDYSKLTQAMVGPCPPVHGLVGNWDLLEPLLQRKKKKNFT